MMLLLFDALILMSGMWKMPKVLPTVWLLELQFFFFFFYFKQHFVVETKNSRLPKHILLESTVNLFILYMYLYYRIEPNVIHAYIYW